MKKIILGGSDIVAPQIALGFSRLNNISNDKAKILVDTAIELGINFFENADIYGGGRGEEIFGDVKDESKRDQMIIQTKCGITPGKKYDHSKNYILDAVDGSLKRLKTDYIDTLVLHRPDALVEPQEVNEAFNILKESGKVRHFGVSNHNIMQIELLQTSLDMKLIVNQLQFSAAHTLLINNGVYFNLEQNQCSFSSAIEYCRMKNITIQAWSPFQYGFLKGTFIDNPDFKSLNDCLQSIGKKYGVSKTAIATAFITRHPAKMQVVVGTTNPDRLRDIVTCDGIYLTREEWYSIYEAAGNPLV